MIQNSSLPINIFDDFDGNSKVKIEKSKLLSVSICSYFSAVKNGLGFMSFRFTVYPYQLNKNCKEQEKVS